jgi:hypothetical protein
MIISLGTAAADNKPARYGAEWPLVVAYLRIGRTQGSLNAEQYAAATRDAKHAAKDGRYIVFADFGVDGTRALANLQASYAVPIDLDKGEWTAERIATHLDGYAFAAHTTYAHSLAAPRWRVVVPVERGMTADEHKATWRTLNELFLEEADPAASDASRLNYLPGPCADPSIAQSCEGTGILFPVSVPEGTVAARDDDLRDGPVDGWSGPTDDDALIAHMLAARGRPEDAFAGPGVPTKFEALWTAEAAYLSAKFPPKESGQVWDHTGADLALANDLAYFTGGDGERVVTLMCRSSLADRPSWREDKARRAALRACNGRTQYAFMRPAAPTVPSGTSPAIPNAHQLSLNRRNQYEASLANLVHVLSVQAQARFGFDQFRGRTMLAPAGTDEWRPINDTDMIRLREVLNRTQNFAEVPKEIMRDALQLVAEQHAFDTAITWLSSLQWDSTPRVDRFLVTHCGAVDDPYSRAVGRYIWSGLAGRVLAPGCQLDMVVALQSPQGKGKSTGLQAMVPAEEFFTDGLSLHEDDDDFKRLLRGKLVVEIAEMAGLTRGDINVVKRTITRRHEEWIEKFQTQPTRYPRRCMLFATTNDERFLPPDETGNRRWLPVEIAALDRSSITRDREQLWAEGAAIYRAAGIAWQDAERLAAGRHAAYEAGDVWEAEIAKWLDTPEPSFKPGTAPGPPPRSRPLAISEVLAGALRMNSAAMDSKAEKRAGRVMRQLGFESRAVRKDGRVAKCWVHPACNL